MLRSDIIQITAHYWNAIHCWQGWICATDLHATTSKSIF